MSVNKHPRTSSLVPSASGAENSSQISDVEHLNSLRSRLSSERSRLSSATGEAEKKIRGVWVSQLEAEIRCEEEHLGLLDHGRHDFELGDDELLAQLFQ